MDPFTRLPNEIIDAIFIHLRPDEVWTTQQCSTSTERALDPHLRTRLHAIDYLMWWACRDGNNKAVRKAVSLGADVSVVRAVPGDRSDSEHSTIHCACYNLDTVRLLLDLGVRLDIDFKGVADEGRENLERNFNPEVYKLFSDRGMTDQFIDFKDSIDHCLSQEIIGWWNEIVEGPDIMENISILLELGASSVTLIQNPGGFTGTTLSYTIKCMHDWYDYQPAPWCLPILKLLLSKRPDLNAPSLEITGRFLRDPDVLMWWEAHVCPIAAAVWCMVVLGYEYLISHGASFEPVWHLGESGRDIDSTPIFFLCKDWHDSIGLEGRTLLFDDGKLGIIKLFIERGSVKKLGLRFVKNVLRPITDEEIEGDKQPAVIERSHILLRLILRDENLDPNNRGAIHELISEIVDQAFANVSGSGQFLYFSNIIDSILVAILLQKGAKLETRSLTKDVRDYVVSELQRDPYNIRIDI
ncbi:unnamed protein product [Fusarium equiseti]|uniref:F-box domain-containing protein n=1 Tax=Fusarium equiseti TaxID=61235 RepID=A0A8J2J5H0_FUSEQ|nr:unnamed protein product [Fusarium equiseti]